MLPDIPNNLNYVQTTDNKIIYIYISFNTIHNMHDYSSFINFFAWYYEYSCFSWKKSGFIIRVINVPIKENQKAYYPLICYYYSY